MKEIWKDIKGYEGLYQISNIGRVKSLDRIVKSRYDSTSLFKERLLTPQRDTRGYKHVSLRKEGKSKHKRVHRLIALAFIPNPENKPEVNHIDGNKMNNGIDNLEWSTHSENIQHAYQTGLNKGPQGAKNSHAKLTEKQVYAIRDLKGKITPKEIGVIFKVTRCAIYDIHSGRSWGHLYE